MRITAHLSDARSGQEEDFTFDLSENATIRDLYEMPQFGDKFNVHIAADMYYRLQNESLIAFPHMLQYIIYGDC